MDIAALKDLKLELKQLSREDILQICLTITKHKKENKELLTYLLFWKSDEDGYVEMVKEYINEMFAEVKSYSSYTSKKSARKILRYVKKQIRFSKKPETEAELLLHFCYKLKNMRFDYKRNSVLRNTFDKQLEMAEKAVGKMHEDLRYDYELEIESIKES